MAFLFVRSALAAYLLLFLLYSAHAQTDFRDGFIIKSTQDTVYGFVAYRENDRRYKVCDFKTNKNENAISYSPSQVKGYGYIQDKYYEAKGDSVFFELLVSGRIALYKYERQFWVQKNGGELYALKDEVKDVIKNGVRYQRNTKEYLGILSMLMESCSELKSSLKNVRLTEKPLTEFIEHNNRCAGSDVQVFKERKPWTKTLVGISIGFTNSQLRFTSSQSSFSHLTKPSPGSTPFMIGATAEIFSPRISERISFVPSVYFMTSKYLLYSENSFPSITERNFVTLSLKQLKFPVGLRYTFTARTITPFVEVGGSYAFHLQSSQRWIQEVETVNVNTFKRGDSFIYKSYQLGAWGGIGLIGNISKKLSALVQFRYEFTDGLVTEEQNLNSSVKNYQLILGIRTR